VIEQSADHLPDHQTDWLTVGWAPAPRSSAQTALDEMPGHGPSVVRRRHGREHLRAGWQTANLPTARASITPAPVGLAAGAATKQPLARLTILPGVGFIDPSQSTHACRPLLDV